MVALPDRLYLPTIDIGTDGADINSTSSGNALTLGDQNSLRQRWGRASFDRTSVYFQRYLGASGSEAWDVAISLLQLVFLCNSHHSSRIRIPPMYLE
jgi:hypothetical protein